MDNLQYRHMQKTSHDLSLFKKCFDRNIEKKRKINYYEWLYYNNPKRELLVDFAVETKKDHEIIAGIYALLPNSFKIGESNYICTQSLDTLTDKNYRRLGLFTKLANSMYERVKDYRIPFVYGFPNENSAHTFFERLGWKRLDFNPKLIKMLRFRPEYLVSNKPSIQKVCRLFPDIRLRYNYKITLSSMQEIKDIGNFNDEQFDSLWKGFSSSINITLERDSSYLNWRLIEAPHKKYRTLAFYDNKILKGFVSYSTYTKNGIHNRLIGRILELIYIPSEVTVGVTLLRFAANDLASQGCEAMLSFCLPHSPNYDAYRKLGFRYLPKFIRPKNYFGVKNICTVNDVDIENIKNWYISYCDVDTV